MCLNIKEINKIKKKIIMNLAAPIKIIKFRLISTRIKNKNKRKIVTLFFRIRFSYSLINSRKHSNI